MVLKGHVPRDCVADAFRVAGRQANSERALHVKPAPPFPCCDGRCDHASADAIAIRPSGHAGAEKYRDDIISVFFVTRTQSVFAEEGHIAESVTRLRTIVFEIRRHVEYKLHVLAGDKFQTLASAKVDQTIASRRLLDQKVRAKFLLQPRSHRGQRRYPMWLICLGLVGACEPVV